MMATIEIMPRVFSLDVASHNVKLCDGLMLDGMIIGNNVTPAVKMMQAIAILDIVNATPARRETVAQKHTSKLVTAVNGISQSCLLYTSDAADE